MRAFSWCLLAGASLALAERPSGWGPVSVSTTAKSGTTTSTTTKGFSTVIPCPYADHASVATVTSTEQIIVVSRSTSTKTAVTTTTTSFRRHGRPIPKVATLTSYTTFVKEWNAPYKDLGPLAIPGYPGSDLCQKRCHGPDGEVLQVLKAIECRSSNAAPAICNAWPETWMFQPTATSASTAKTVVTSAVTMKSAGTFTFPFVQRAPPATITVPARTFTYTTTNPTHGARTVTVTVTKTSVVFEGRQWTAMVTRSCSGPTVTDITVTVSTTLTYTLPPFTPPPRPTPVPVPTSWADWVISSTSAAPVSTGKTSSSTGSPVVSTSTGSAEWSSSWSSASSSASSSAVTTASTATGSSSGTPTSTETSASTTTSPCNSATATAASGMTYELYYRGAGNMSVRAVEQTWMYPGSMPICEAIAKCAQDEYNLRGNAPSSFDVVKWLGFDTWYCNLYLTGNSNPDAFRQRQALIIDTYAYNGVVSISSSMSTATETATATASTAESSSFPATETSSSLTSSETSETATAITTAAPTDSTSTTTTTTTSTETPSTTCSSTLVTATAGPSSFRYNRYFYGTGVQVPGSQAGTPLPEATDACNAIQLCANSQAAINTEDGTFIVTWNEPTRQWQCFTHTAGTSAANPQAFTTPDANTGAVYAFGLDIPLPPCYHFTVNETSYTTYYTGSGNRDSRTPTGSSVISAGPTVSNLCDAVLACANLLYGQNPDEGDFDVYVAMGQPDTWYCDVYAGDDARDTSVFSVGSNDVIRMYGFTSA